MSKAKYPIGTIVKHNKSGIIAQILDRDFYVSMIVLKGDPSKNNKIAYNSWHCEKDKYILRYAPNSVNRLFTDLGPASKILYAKD